MHTTEDDGSPPEVVLTDFAQLVGTATASQQQSPLRISAITLPPSYVPPGQPPNAPIRKSKKTAGFIVNEDNSSHEEDDNVPLAKSAAYAKNKNSVKNDVLPDKNRVMEQSHNRRKSRKHQHPRRLPLQKKASKS